MSVCPPEPRLIDGPDAAPVTVLLAHGAGTAIDSPFMSAMASGLAGNWATAPGESSPRYLRSPLAAAFEQDPQSPTEPAEAPQGHHGPELQPLVRRDHHPPPVLDAGVELQEAIGLGRQAVMKAGVGAHLYLQEHHRQLF